MIFVTVGNHPRSFERLIKSIDDMLKSGEINEQVIIQTGYTNYTPIYADSFKFKPMDDIIELIKKANIVITHGGIGSILTSLKFGKPTIVVPRLKKFNEHTNDHQLEITQELEKEGRIIAVYDISDFKDALNRAKNFKYKVRGPSKIVGIVKSYLEEINGI